MQQDQPVEQPPQRPALQPPARSNADEDMVLSQVLHFTLGEQAYGLDVSYVYEVSQMVAITELPDSPPDVLGVIDYRGTVVPVVDLRTRFKLEVDDATTDTPIIIAWTGKFGVGLVVEEIREVLSIPPHHIMEPEEFGQPRRHVAGVAKIDDGLLLIMNPRGLISEEFAANLQPPNDDE